MKQGVINSSNGFLHKQKLRAQQLHYNQQQYTSHNSSGYGTNSKNNHRYGMEEQ